MSAARLVPEEVQGNILRAYKLTAACYLFLRVEDPEAARTWLGITTKQVTTAAWDRRGAETTTLNVAISHAGLAALGAPDVVLGAFSEPFRAGMARRAAALGDSGPADPSRWIPAFAPGAVHVLVTIYVRVPDALDRAVAEARGAATDGGLTVVHERRAHEMAGTREHFGFDDGFAQPALEGTDCGPGAQGFATGGGRFKDLPLGEFLLGHRDAEGVVPAAPPGPLGRSSTYLVYRELAQDVAAFRRFVAEAGELIGEDPSWVAARVVGRWADGTPLALSPEHPDPRISGDPSRINDFGYGDDERGFRCPLGAHVRRANPRDALAFGGSMVKRHRIIRRGMPYGAPLPAGRTTDDGVERGLAFVCFNADIARQFEFIQRQWCLDGDPFGLGDDPDPLLAGGTGSNKMTVQGEVPRFISPIPRLVTTRGGEYFFVPSLPALEAIARGELR